MNLAKAELILDPADKRLHEKVKAVKDVNAPKVVAVVQKMKEIQRAVGAIGLAANQLGINMRIITAYHEGVDEIIEFINPRLINDKEEHYYQEKDIYWDNEGCLSHPGITAEVARYSPILISCYRLNHTGELKIQASGMIARIIQHEICHLNGRLITDMEQYVRNIIPIPGGQVQLLEATAKHDSEGQKDYLAES